LAREAQKKKFSPFSTSITVSQSTLCQWITWLLVLTGNWEKYSLRHAGWHSIRRNAHVEAHVVAAHPLESQHWTLADEAAALSGLVAWAALGGLSVLDLQLGGRASSPVVVVVVCAQFGAVVLQILSIFCQFFVDFHQFFAHFSRAKRRPVSECVGRVGETVARQTQGRPRAQLGAKLRRVLSAG